LLEGVVTNVTNFGAFVDVGVHQDGLVHISMLAHKFVKDPHEVVKAGDVVKVKVLEVDVARKRIALTMKLDEAPPRARPNDQAPRTAERGRDHGHQAGPARPQQRPQQRNQSRDGESQGNGLMAEAFAKALKPKN